MSFDSPKKRFVKSVLGLMVLAVSVWVVLFSGASAITTENIELRLQQLGAHLADEAAQHGKEAKLTYGTIEVEGWGYNKRATVDNISLELSEKTPLNTTHRWSFSTVQMQVLPDPMLPNNLFFVFSEPVNVIENSQLKTIISFSAPPKYGYFDGRDSKEHAVIHSLRLPSQLILTPGKAVDEIENKGHTITITFDENPLMQLRLLPESHERTMVYGFRNVSIMSDDGSQATIAALESNVHETLGADNRPQGKSQLKVLDIVLRDHEKVSKAYSLITDIDYSGDAPGLEIGNWLSGSGASDMTINQMQLATDDFKIKMTGKVSLATNDPLPSGDVNLEIENVKQFLESELIPAMAKPSLTEALQKVTGQPVAALSHATLPVKREKNGVMYVGGVTFEELAATMLKGLFQLSAPAAKVIPPATLPPDAEEEEGQGDELPASEKLPNDMPQDSTTPEPAPEAAPAPAPSKEAK